MMPFPGIQLLFETLVQRTRDVCKCEMRDNGSNLCNESGAISAEPVEVHSRKFCCTAK